MAGGGAGVGFGTDLGSTTSAGAVDFGPGGITGLQAATVMALAFGAALPTTGVVTGVALTGTAFGTAGAFGGTAVPVFALALGLGGGAFTCLESLGAMLHQRIRSNTIERSGSGSSQNLSDEARTHHNRINQEASYRTWQGCFRKKPKLQLHRTCSFSNHAGSADCPCLEN